MHFVLCCLYISHFQFLALITLSLVAGFSVNVSSYIECSETPINYSIAIKASYPFRDFKRTVINTTSAGNGINITNVGFGDSGVPRAAEYLVAWGSLTLFYCVIAVLVYMLVTANEQLEKAFDFLVVTVSTATIIVYNRICTFSGPSQRYAYYPSYYRT